MATTIGHVLGHSCEAAGYVSEAQWNGPLSAGGSIMIRLDTYGLWNKSVFYVSFFMFYHLTNSVVDSYMTSKLS